MDPEVTETATTSSAPVKSEASSTSGASLTDLPDEIILRIMHLLTANTRTQENNKSQYQDFLNFALINQKIFKISFDLQANRLLTIKSKGSDTWKTLNEEFPHKDWVTRAALEDKSFPLKKFADNFPHISHLDLSRHEPSAEDLKDFFTRHGKNIKSLNLTGNSNLNKDVFLAIRNNCFSLSELHLQSCGTQVVNLLSILTPEYSESADTATSTTTT